MRRLVVSSILLCNPFFGKCLLLLRPQVDNLRVDSRSKPERDVFPQIISAEVPVPHFRKGAIILATLQSPREKFFGALLGLSSFGIVLCGIPLESIDDFITQLRDGEPVRPAVLFFSMHRIERLEIDQPSGDVPSLSERFQRKSSLDPAQVFNPEDAC